MSGQTVHAEGQGISRCDLPRCSTLVRWQHIIDVGVALVTSSTSSPTEILPILLDRLTIAHRILEQLEVDAERVLAGDVLGKEQLRRRFSLVLRASPNLRGSGRQVSELARNGNSHRLHDQTGEFQDLEGTRTVSFDGLVRLVAAAALATPEDDSEALDRATDVLLGLAMHALILDQLAIALRVQGPGGVAQVLHELRANGNPAVVPTPLQIMRGTAPTLPGGDLPIGDHRGGLRLGGLSQPENIRGHIQELLGKLRDHHRWDPNTWDRGPLWRDLLGLPREEEIDRSSIIRIRCLLALKDALELRKEQPPPRPERVVWSDSITGITINGMCPGDTIVVNGTHFGGYNPNIGVLLPMVERCQAFPVSSEQWTDTAITITLPDGISSGPVGLVDLSYVRQYDEWVARINQLTKQILDLAKCAQATAPDVNYLSPFGECPPATTVNRLRAGRPVIQSFKVNGLDLVAVEPGQPFLLQWSLHNTEHSRLVRTSRTGPLFAGNATLDSPSSNSYVLGPFTENTPVAARYELHATGPCGTATSAIEVLLRKVPVLEIDGIEVTQGINWTPMSRQNSPEFKLRPLLQLQRNSAAPCVQGKHPSRRQNGLG